MTGQDFKTVKVDYLYAIEKTNAAIGKLILAGSIQARLSLAITELATVAIIKECPAKELSEWIFVQVKETKPRNMTDDQAESVAKAICTLRVMLVDEHQIEAGEGPTSNSNNPKMLR